MAADVFAYVRIGTMERRSSPREERLSIVLSSLGSCIRCVSGEERQRQDAFPVMSTYAAIVDPSELVPNSYSGSKVTSS